MRIGINDALHAFLFRFRPPAPIQIKPLRRCVEFNPSPSRRRGVEHGRDVDRIWLAFQQKTSRRMRENRDKRIMHRPDYALRHLSLGQIENGMDRCDDEIELGKNLVIEIEFPAAENVALDAGEQSKAIKLFIELPNRRDL